MIDDIAQKVYGGVRLEVEDARRLLAHPNLAELGMLANWVRHQRHGNQIVTYNVGRNINYTKVCWVKCDFCAFYRAPGSEEGYVLPHDEVFAKIDELVAFGGDEPKSCEILMQGGLNPKLRLEYYEDLLGQIARMFFNPIHPDAQEQFQGPVQVHHHQHGWIPWLHVFRHRLLRHIRVPFCPL